MKRSMIAVLILLLCATVAFAAPFAPQLLKLSAAHSIQYAFDGSQTEIPVTVSGAPALTWFFVYTKGKGASIGTVTNGYLGWHYINKIDTCIYMSAPTPLAKGTNKILWNGKSSQGKLVTSGDYTYYMWAYDATTPKTRMSKFFYGNYHTMDIQERDVNGVPLANPVLYSRNFALKWTIGNDPADSTLAEYCTFTLPSGWGKGDNMWMDQSDFEYFYQGVKNSDSKAMGITRWKWVPNGEGQIQAAFGDNGYALWESNCDSHSPVVVSDKNYLYTVDQEYHNKSASVSNFYIYDFEGTQVAKLDMAKWWADSNDMAAGAQLNGGPDDHNIRNGKVFLNCHCSCLNQMVDPVAWLASGDENDFYQWGNANGDYVLDHNFEENSGRPWVCNDYSVGPYKYNQSADDNLFSIIPCFDMGAVSFGMYAPDGTGVGYLAFQGETGGFKLSNIFVDSGTPFDGIYCDNNSAGGLGTTVWGTEETRGTWFVGHDSIKGNLSERVGVASAPAAFAVAQNSPNPFNPTTTISFTLAKAGKTTVEVYNVAGQKIDTLVNGSMSSGSHSVVWNASKFSAGVYFYTVKSGEFSKTIKMTLLK